MKRYSHLKWYYSLLLALAVAAQSIFSSQAQDEEQPQPVYPITIFDSLFWSSDSKVLVFADVGDLTQYRWFTYDAILKVLTEHPAQPLQTLTDTCPDLRDLRLDQISPSSAYVTLNREVEGQTFYGGEQVIQIGIADCVTGESQIFYDLTSNGRFLWSDDETSFLHIAPGSQNPLAQGELVSGYSSGISNAVLHHLDALQVDNMFYSSSAIYDLTADGQWVLLKIHRYPDDPQLYLYNTIYPTASRIIELDATSIAAAQFAPYNENKLWLFNAQGIIDYDPESGEVQIVDSTWTSENLTSMYFFEKAIFSPDGRFIALITDTTQADSAGLHVLDLSEQIARFEGQTRQDDTPFLFIASDTQQRLWITASCSGDVAEGDMLRWTVHNPNSDSLSVDYRYNLNPTSSVYRLKVSGGSVDHPSTTSFEVPAKLGTNQIVISIDGIFHDQRACFVPQGE